MRKSIIGLVVLVFLLAVSGSVFATGLEDVLKLAKESLLHDPIEYDHDYQHLIAMNEKDLKLTQEEIDAVKGKGYKVLYSEHLSGEKSTIWIREGWREILDPLGIKFGTMDSNLNIEKQIADIENMIQQKPDVIALLPADSVGIVIGVQKINQAGIPVIIEEGAQLSGGGYTSATCGNYREAGVILAKEMSKMAAKKWPGQKIAVGICPMTVSLWYCDERVVGFKKGVAQTNNLQIVAESGANFNEEAMRVFTDMLTAHPEIKMGFATWSSPASGMAAAAKNMNRSDIIIGGYDVADDCAPRIKSGTDPYKITMARNLRDRGRILAKLAVITLAKKRIVPRNIIFEYHTVTQDNIEAVYEAQTYATIPGVKYPKNYVVNKINPWGY
jgi:ribose transport system substrate-binding protein